MTDIHQEFCNSHFFNSGRIDKRSVDALIGIAIGIVADGDVNQAEAKFLLSWMQENLAQLDDPVVNILYRRLSAMLSDNILDAEESKELLELLLQLSGKPKSPEQPYQTPTSLPLDHPAPSIVIPERVFVFTGVMAYGPRRACEALVLERGGSVTNNLTTMVNYLVIGSIGNKLWLHSSYGTKIKKAVELRDRGSGIAIITEDLWQQAVFG